MENFKDFLVEPLAVNPSEIETFYAARSERARLESGIGRLEAARTCELLCRYLPPAPAIVCDVGGGTGYYARWLAERGYDVHLLDIVPAHIAQAGELYPALSSAQVGDARQLPWPDASADAVLLMGPLYHLRERADRVRALTEAHRVLRPGGILFGTVIPRWASALIGMVRGWIYDDSYVSMVGQEISSGQHAPPANWSLFMDGFFHNAEDLISEMHDAGFESPERIAIEGPSWLCHEFDSAWDDPTRRKRILELSRLAERDPEIRAASPHVAVVAVNG